MPGYAVVMLLLETIMQQMQTEIFLGLVLLLYLAMLMLLHGGERRQNLPTHLRGLKMIIAIVINMMNVEYVQARMLPAFSRLLMGMLPTV